MKTFFAFVVLLVTSCQVFSRSEPSVMDNYHALQKIETYSESQQELFETLLSSNSNSSVERNKYILSELWKFGELENELKSKITRHFFNLVLLQIYGNYQAPNFVVRSHHEFPFPSVFTRFTPELIINDKVVWSPGKPQTSHSMSSNNSTITSRIGGVVKNGDVIQYKIIIQEFRRKELKWQYEMFTNKVIAKGLKNCVDKPIGDKTKGGLQVQAYFLCQDGVK